MRGFHDGVRTKRHRVKCHECTSQPDSASIRFADVSEWPYAVEAQLREADGALEPTLDNPNGMEGFVCSCFGKRSDNGKSNR